MRRHRIPGLSLRLAQAAVACVLLGCCLAAAQDTRPKPAEEGGTIKGTVLGAGDRPLPSVSVQVSGNGVKVPGVLTFDDGTFEAKVPKVGTYTIRLSADGYRPVRATVSVELPQQIATPTFRMTPAQLLIQVYGASGGGSIQPLPNVQLQLTPHDGGESVSAQTDASGSRYFDNLRVGTSYTITATLIGYEPASTEALIASGRTAARDILLSKGSSIPIARSKLRYGAPKLPSDDVPAIFQDDAGYVWFATDRGVARFDGTNFESSATPASEVAPLDGKDVRCMAQFDGAMWFGAVGGLWRLAGGKAAPVSELADQTVAAIAADPGGGGWVAASDGLYLVARGQASRVADGAFTAIASDASDRSLWIVGGAPPGLLHFAAGELQTPSFAGSPALGGRPVTAVLRTRSGELFVGTAGGAFRLAGDAPEPFLDDEPPGAVTAMAEDVRGNIWVATEKGAVTYDARRKVTNVEFIGERVGGLTNDREGNLWFATEKGAIRRDLYSFVPIRTSDGLINNNVTWIYPDRAEAGAPELWFATAAPGGVQRFSASAKFERYDGLNSSARVNHVTRDRDGKLWFATSAGVFRREGDTVEEISKEPALWLAQTDDGTIWVATEAGVRTVNGKALDPVPDLARFSATRLFALDNALWLATDRGAVRYVLATRTVEAIDVSRGVQGDAVRWVAADRAGHVWLATDAGAEVLDAQTLKKVEGNAGVVSGTDARSLLVDADGFVWIGSANGIVRKIAFYDGGVAETTFTSEQGIAGSLVNAIVQDASGTIWFATDGGATEHLPTRTLPTLVPRVEVDGRPFDPAGVVPAGQHTIRFLFHGITMLGDVRYLYRLDSDGPWQQLPPKQELERDVSFTELGPGSHVFEIRALNRDLYGVDAPPVRIPLRIDVHIWNKWWFYGLGLLAVVGLGAGAGVAYRYRTREYVLPPELRHYVAIEPNPFIVGNPIRNEAMFFGREDDFRYVRTKLEGASQGVVVVLCGDRRTGKSSILYQILNGRLGGRFIPVFVDLQEMVVANDREFFRRLGRLIAEAIHMDRAEVDRHGLSDERLNPYHQFVDFLDAALAEIGDRMLLLLVDEYELLESKVEEGRLDAEIFLFLAGLIDSKERLSMVFTGSRRLEERDRRYWREFLRRSLFRKIGYLSGNDARRLIMEPVANRVVFGRNVVDRIVRLTAGQPFYTQVICQTAVDYLNEHERNALAWADLEKVVAEIVDHPLPQMIYFWDALSPDEKVVLSLLAGRLEEMGEYGWASAADLVALVEREKLPVDLSENTIHLTLEELFRLEVLEKSPFEAYRFRIDLLRVWIRRSHSIWQVLKAP
jgi:ligand-binding sensor domain-containing protein